MSNAAQTDENTNQIGDECEDDRDNDNYCDANLTVIGTPATCSVGGSTKLDCNDDNSAIHPDRDEICDGKDNDCDGLTDETGSRPSSVGDGSNDPNSPTLVTGTDPADVAEVTLQKTFLSAVDQDYYYWQSVNFTKSFWICRVSGLSTGMTVKIMIGFTYQSQTPPWKSTSVSPELGNNGTYSTAVPIGLPPYAFLGGVIPVSGISPCFSSYTLKCKGTTTPQSR